MRRARRAEAAIDEQRNTARARRKHVEQHDAGLAVPNLVVEHVGVAGVVGACNLDERIRRRARLLARAIERGGRLMGNGIEGREQRFLLVRAAHLPAAEREEQRDAGDGEHHAGQAGRVPAPSSHGARL
jgi:hypothetical protein